MLQTDGGFAHALQLDAQFPPALCEQLMLAPPTTLPEARGIHALNLAFKRGFAFAGYQ
jgi:hypothetical protein